MGVVSGNAVVLVSKMQWVCFQKSKCACQKVGVVVKKEWVWLLVGGGFAHYCMELSEPFLKCGVM